MAPDYDKMSPEQLHERRASLIGVGLAGVGVNGLLLGLEGMVSRVAPAYLDVAQRFVQSPDVTMPTLLVGIGSVVYSAYMLLDQDTYLTRKRAGERITRLDEERAARGAPTLLADMARVAREKRERRKKGPNPEYLRPGLPITELYAPLLRRLFGREEQTVSNPDQSARPDA